MVESYHLRPVVVGSRSRFFKLRSAIGGGGRQGVAARVTIADWSGYLGRSIRAYRSDNYT